MQHKKSIFIIIVLLLIISVWTIIILRQKNNDDGISLEETADAIVKIMPRSDLYVATSVIEEFTNLRQTEYHLGLIPEEHSCVQTLQQKVSYKISMTDIKYSIIDRHTIMVHIPESQYSASTINSSFISDDEEYWYNNMPSTKNMKHKVETKIKKLFDTAENRKKSKLYAQEAITHIINQLGYQVMFEDDVLPSPQTDNF